MAYYSEQETVWTDVAMAATAAFGGYTFASLAKLGGNPVYPLLGTAAVGVGALGVKHLTDGVAHEVLEGLGSGAFWGLGWWVAETTTTIGGRPAGAPPFWHPGAPVSTKSGSTSSSSAAAAAEAALRALQARASVTPSLAMAGRAPAAALAEEW